jgi:hypothetical protein
VPGNKGLKILAPVHFVPGVVTGVLAQVGLSRLLELREILIVPLFASALCQSFLLSLWAAAVRHSVRRKRTTAAPRTTVTSISGDLLATSGLHIGSGTETVQARSSYGSICCRLNERVGLGCCSIVPLTAR